MPAEFEANSGSTMGGGYLRVYFMELSNFGKRFKADSGINQLMSDLGEAMNQGDVLMLGGGNPGRVPEVESYLSNQLELISQDKDKLRRMLCNYATPSGEERFREALAHLLNQTYGWPITKENVVLTAGSQNGLFTLFNCLAGKTDDADRHILFPITPEYIGYEDQALSNGMFKGNKSTIELLDNNLFKYRVDFSTLNITEDTAALCVSRPTNPTGNVLTDSEVTQLSELATAHDIPLIIDSAYGVPFPNIIFTEAKPVWNENIVLSMSLSKLGLPATRTGIFIASQEIVELVSRVNAVTNLAVISVGAVLVSDLVESGDILSLSQNYVRPFYQQKVEQALDWLRSDFAGLNYRVHKPEGALFLWLWFPELPISAQELYERLKAQGVLVIAGQHFYPGLEQDWDHKHQCIRITYSQHPDVVRKGIKLIAEEIRSL